MLVFKISEQWGETAQTSSASSDIDFCCKDLPEICLKSWAGSDTVPEGRRIEKHFFNRDCWIQPEMSVLFKVWFIPNENLNSAFHLLFLLARTQQTHTKQPWHANYVQPSQYLQSFHDLIIAYFISNLLHSGGINDFSFSRCFRLLWELHARWCLVQTVFYWPLWVRKQKFNPTSHSTNQKPYFKT